ncbi:MAG: ribose 5-phosphate isomerase B [Acidobacteriota bacterium]|nr:ribose 5-phosphate isomerase B [Acidobacteriota bacterium]
MSGQKIIAVGADHAGFDLKQALCGFLEQQGYEVKDLGTHSTESTDYPDYAGQVARAVAAGEAERGLLVCGTGIGMAMAANRFAGVRAANCFDTYACAMARAHNDANVLTLAARMLAQPYAEEILRVFLDTAFEGGRHQRRVDKMDSVTGG